MVRRVTAMLITAVMLCMFGGCSFLYSVAPPPANTDTAPDHTTYLHEFRDRRCYRVLPAHLQSLYGALYTAVKTCDADTVFSIRGEDGNEREYTGVKVALPSPLTKAEDARTLFYAFTTDNPAFFFVGNTYSYEGYRVDGVDYYDTFCLTFLMDTAARRIAEQELETAVATLLSALPEGADEYTVERHLHDALAARVTYDRDVAEGDVSASTRPHTFSAYGALVNGQAVCEGYARAMQLLLQRAAIPCTLVSGTADDTAHMWNMVEIDGRSYHLDATWDDAQDKLQHTFFNLTTEEIARTHTIGEENLGVDTCTATEANFYRLQGWQLDTYDRSLIAEAVAKQVASGAETVELRFTADTFATAQLFIANNRRLRQYTDPFLQGESLWDYTYQVNEDYHTVTLYKEI
ncbi:MAG: hypothetical protein E7552_05850 [Ruminococcaceae bacterium]|nr:hypothetical protein [Oscillospiraceae bacterium]